MCTKVPFVFASDLNSSSLYTDDESEPREKVALFLDEKFMSTIDIDVDLNV